MKALGFEHGGRCGVVCLGKGNDNARGIRQPGHTHSASMNTATTEIREGQRFEFGKNWSRFLVIFDEQRICEAERSLAKMLGGTNLKGKLFLDIGSGSGLFSLAARRLGAHVHSFDYDTESVACTQYLKQKFFPKDTQWKVEKGSVLDLEYLSKLGQFDIVYSWGVLHH